MKIVHVTGGEYKDVLGTYDDYERYDDGSDQDVFFYGYNSSRHVGVKSDYAHYKNRVYLNLEAPCSFFTTQDSSSSQNYFTQVYTICPYTAEWLSGGDTKYIPVIQPYRSDFFLEYEVGVEKTNDVIYHGGLYSPIHHQVIDVMSKYDYVFSSLVRNRGVTHRGISSRDKWGLIASSRCSVGINLLYPSPPHIANIKAHDGWKNNMAFDDLDSMVVPQSKARIVEAAACRTLNLVMRDRWNVIEHWFAGDEFVYWDTIEELDYLINDVSCNFDKYTPIIDRAFTRVQNYTTEKFYKHVCENLR